MKLVLILLLLIPFIEGCADKPDMSYNDPYVHFPNGQATLQGFSSWDVQCRSNDCPTNAGQFVVKESSTDVGVCTAFLVDSKTIVTNAHCVTALMVGQDCSDQAEIVFPPVAGFPKETRLCGHLVAKTDKPQFTDPDLAVIELKDETKRFPLIIDSSGVQDQQRLTAYKVNPSGNSYGNELVADSCRVVMHPFYLPEFSNSKDATIAFTDCKIVHGNSGSPLVNERGQVAAVLFGDIEKNERMSDFYNRLGQASGYNLAPTSELDAPDLQNRHFNLATNAACLRGLSPVGLNLDGCSKLDANAVGAKDAYAAESKARSQQALVQAVAELGKWAASHSDFVVWTGDVKTEGDDIVLRPKMLCVQPSAQWITAYTQKGWIFTSYDKQASQYFENAPVYRLSKRYDESLRPYFEANPGVDAIGLQFSPKLLMKDKGGDVEIRRISDPAPQQTFSEIALGQPAHAPIETVPTCGKRISSADIVAMYKH